MIIIKALVDREKAFASEVPLPNASRSVASIAQIFRDRFFLQQKMLIDDGMKQLLRNTVRAARQVGR